MNSSFPVSRQVPFGVFIVACIMMLNCVRQLVLKVLPAWETGDLQELVNCGAPFILSIVLVWGLLTLRTWARSWVIVISAAGTLVPAVVLALLQNGEFAAGFNSDPRAAQLLPVLVVVGLLSGVSFGLLKAPSAKRAFSRDV